MIIGYARVSTGEQRLDLQLRALESAGCSRIYTDHGQSGSSFERDGLEAALECLKPGDTLVVWRLDRLGRSLSGLIGLMEQLGRREIHFRSVMESIDTGTSGGRLMFHMIAALAEFERGIISERTRAGMAAARARGKTLGRPRALTEADLRQSLYEIDCQSIAPKIVAARLGVSVRTLQRHVEAMRGPHRRSRRPLPARPPALTTPGRTG